MIGPQKFIGSRDLTALLLGVACHPWARTCYGKPIYQTGNEICIATQYEGVKDDTKCENGMIWGS